MNDLRGLSGRLSAQFGSCRGARAWRLALRAAAVIVCWAAPRRRHRPVPRVPRRRSGIAFPIFSAASPRLQPSAQTPGTAGITAADIDCPTVEIRPGTSTFAVSTAGAEPSALTMRYQASFGQTARECKLAGNVLTIRVGIEGRVVVGPAGGAGQLEIPIRYAVVQEGPDPKTHHDKVALAIGHHSAGRDQCAVYADRGRVDVSDAEGQRA